MQFPAIITVLDQAGANLGAGVARPGSDVMIEVEREGVPASFKIVGADGDSAVTECHKHQVLTPGQFNAGRLSIDGVPV